MITLRSRHHALSEDEMDPCPEQALMAVCEDAARGIRDIRAMVAQLIVMCENGDDPHVRRAFIAERDRCLARVASACLRGRPVFDGHIDVEVIFPKPIGDSVRLRVPNLYRLTQDYHSNFAQVANSDFAEYACRARASRCARISPGATIQGVRLTTFMPRTIKAHRFEALRSLSGLTGLHPASFGNALVAAHAARDTHMPLHGGCMRINRLALAASDGSVDGLITAINAASSQTGVHAEGGVRELMTLINPTGGDIDVRVLNQSAALLSGFPLGASVMPAAENGLQVLVSFSGQSEVTFDSSQTAELITGKPATQLRLMRGHLHGLTLDDLMQQRLSSAVLNAFDKALSYEQACLAAAVQRLTNGFASLKTLGVVDAKNARSHNTQPH